MCNFKFSKNQKVKMNYCHNAVLGCFIRHQVDMLCPGHMAHRQEGGLSSEIIITGTWAGWVLKAWHLRSVA